MKSSFPSFAFKVEDDEPLCPVCEGLIDQHSEEQVTQCYNFLCKGCKEDATRTWGVSCNNFAKLLWDLRKCYEFIQLLSSQQTLSKIIKLISKFLREFK